MTFLLMIAVFLLLIIPHEFGHFLAAKLSGMRVERFSIGFGPKLWGFKRKDTEYLICLFPVGGYVKIAGMAPGEQDVKDGFYSKPFSKKLAVVLSGSLMNFFVSALLFSFIFMVGFQVPDLERAVVGEVIEGSPAQEAGIKPGDRILSINGQKIKRWDEVAGFVQKEKVERLEIMVLRDKETLIFEVKPRFYQEYNRKLIGISPSTKYISYDPFTSLYLGGEKVVFLTGLIMRSLVGMITGEVPPRFAGPVGIAEYVGEASRMGPVPFFSLAALLGVNLGLFNLFPIPALDGGRILFLLVEGVRRKPVKIEFQEFVHYIGFLILIFLMLLITYQDILRIFR